jgi:hypothetical protein
MENQTTYASDYRSPPSGTGVIEKPNGDLILIQDPECSPNDIKPGIYSQIIHLENSFEDNWEIANSELIETLEKQGVSIVYDSELSYQMELDGSPMTLAQFKEFRS